MTHIDDQLAAAFICEKCHQHGATVQRLAMSGTGFSRLFDIQPYRYAFVSCRNCGHTEIFNLATLEGRDDLGTFLDVLFSG
jgi:hypothetical protein